MSNNKTIWQAAVVGSCVHSYKVWTALWVGNYTVTQDAQETSVETIDSYLLKMLNKARKLNVQMKKIVLHVIKNSAAWNWSYSFIHFFIFRISIYR